MVYFHCLLISILFSTYVFEEKKKCNSFSHLPTWVLRALGAGTQIFGSLAEGSQLSVLHSCWLTCRRNLEEGPVSSLVACPRGSLLKNQFLLLLSFLLLKKIPQFFRIPSHQSSPFSYFFHTGWPKPKAKITTTCIPCERWLSRAQNLPAILQFIH